MKTILVPTDFSNAAEAALDAAMVLARQQQAKLHIIHVFSIDYAAAPVPPRFVAEEKREMRLYVTEKLRLLCKRIDVAGDLVYTSVVEEGWAVDTIVREAKKTGAELIMMGSKGERDTLDHLFGTTVTGVLVQSPCAVMTIPAGCKLRSRMKKITYATELKSADMDNIRSLIVLARPMDAEISILHVGSRKELEKQGPGAVYEFAKKVEDKTGYRDISCEVLAGHDAEKELMEYVSGNKTDMLVLSMEHRSWLGRLFDASISKELATSSPVPVIVFHHHQSEVKIFS